MSLPLLNIPKYTTTLPSGLQVTFRPFTVAEEKILLIAQEAKEPSQMVTAIRQVILNCTDSLNFDALSIYDVEYLLLKIRTKSVGEVSKIALKCDCESKGVLRGEVNLESDVQVVTSERSNLVQLTPDIAVTLKDVPFSTIVNFAAKKVSEMDASIDLICKSIETIVSGDQVIASADHSMDELRRFVLSMTKDQMTKIQEFVSSAPKLTVDAHLTCDKCGKAEVRKLTGIQSFFT